MIYQYAQPDSQFAVHHQDRVMLIQNGQIMNACGRVLLPPAPYTPQPVTDALQWPHLRAWLLCYVHALSDKETHLTQWTNTRYPHAVWDHMQDILLFMGHLNVGYLDDQSAQLIGYVFFNDAEVNALGDLNAVIYELMVTVGSAASDDAYLKNPYWNSLVHHAHVLYQLLLS